MSDFHGDPNSAHQHWSRWEFGIEASPRKLPGKADVLDNARRYFAAGFTSEAGRVRCELFRTPRDVQRKRRATYYYLAIEIEGPPANDPLYREQVREDFARRFMEPGFGQSARLVMFRAQVLAGETEDGSPPEQLIVLPTLAVSRPASSATLERG
ncbi:MAG: hypothetical protein H0V56_08905 [Chthoniobacterales bacterium]|nr:hypothetical protein [Chthoniobacterales bacterium]